MGLGVKTTVTRTWDASAAELQLVGTWKQHNEARRMAMLAVYQVRPGSLQMGKVVMLHLKQAASKDEGAFLMINLSLGSNRGSLREVVHQEEVICLMREIRHR